MGVREETVALLRSGLSPSQICGHMGVSLKTTLGYLEQMIGQGVIRRSDIFYSLTPEVRDALNRVSGQGKSQNPTAVWARLERAKLTRAWQDQVVAEGDIEVFCRFGNSRVAMGDMYEDLREIEIGLHKFIRQVLQKDLGQKDTEWWVKGVPLKVRQACVIRREEELDACDRHAYHFTDVVHLAEILKANWQYFEPYARRISKKSNFKKNLLDQIGAMNGIRKRVMHPVRFSYPTEADFQLTRELRAVTRELVKGLRE